MNRAVDPSKLKRRSRLGPQPTVEEAFWESVVKTNGCWLWKGHTRKGYGLIMAEAKNISAHRLSYQIANGSIPDGLNVCHRCDNPPCTNPEHLFLGTQADNIRDCLQKGRRYRSRNANQASG